MAPWVKDWRGRSCGVGRRAAGVESLAWELPYAAGVAEKEKNVRGYLLQYGLVNSEIRLNGLWC